MRYIDKKDNDNHIKFKSIVDPYLQNGKYRYDNLNDDDRIKLREIISLEQDMHCAYCIRTLSASQTTSDHVIPKTIDVETYGKAYGFFGEKLYRKDFIWDKKYTPLSVGRFYPHSLAYGNLVCACYDCNSSKDNDIVRPAFFNDKLTHLSYNDKGIVIFNPTDTFPKQLKTWLNNDKYALIRSLWRAIKLAGISIEDVEAADNEEKRETIFKQLAEHITHSKTINKFPQIISEFSVNSTWKQFLRFKWFWTYY